LRRKKVKGKEREGKERKGKGEVIACLPA